MQQTQLQRRSGHLQRQQTDSSQAQSHYAAVAAAVVTAVSVRNQATSESGMDVEVSPVCIPDCVSVWMACMSTNQ